MLKAAAIAQLETAIATGELAFGQAAGTRPLTAMVDDGSATTFAARYGYPAPLAELLVALANCLEEESALALVRNFLAVVRPGADLRPIPPLVMLHMIDDVMADQVAHREIGQCLATLHRREAAGTEPLRREWADLRRRIVEAEEEEQDKAAKSILRLWAEAAWPTSNGTAMLAATFQAWRSMTRYADGWSDEQEAATLRLLQTLWDEAHDARTRGEVIDYPARLHAAQPQLAVGFENNLAAANRLAIERGRQLATMLVAILAAA